MSPGRIRKKEGPRQHKGCELLLSCFLAKSGVTLSQISAVPREAKIAHSRTAAGWPVSACTLPCAGVWVQDLCFCPHMSSILPVSYPGHGAAGLMIKGTAFLRAANLKLVWTADVPQSCLALGWKWPAARQAGHPGSGSAQEAAAWQLL